MLKYRNYDVTPYIILILSLTLTQNGRGVGECLRGVLWIWSAKSARWAMGWGLVGEECEVARGGNVDCSAERDMNDTMVTSGGDI